MSLLICIVSLLTSIVSLLAYIFYILCGFGRRIASLDVCCTSFDICSVSFGICSVSFDVYFVWLRATNNESLFASASFACPFPGLALSLCLSLFPSFSLPLCLSFSLFLLSRACVRSLSHSFSLSISLPLSSFSLNRFPSLSFPFFLCSPPLAFSVPPPQERERYKSHLVSHHRRSLGTFG